MTQSLTQDVPANVRVELARRRVSATSLATHLGISTSAMHRRLVGDVPFNVHELRRVADFLEVRVADLLGESEAVGA